MLRVTRRKGHYSFASHFWQCVTQSTWPKIPQNSGLLGDGRRVVHPRIFTSQSAVQRSLQSSWQWQKNTVRAAIRSTTELFWSLSRKLLMFSAFYGSSTDVQFQSNRPKWPFPITHQKPHLALSAFWHILAVTAESFHAPPRSLPSNSISQTHLKSNLLSFSLPPFFSSLIFPFVILATSF